MPKLCNKPPKMCHRKDRDIAYVTCHGEKIYLGKWGEKKTLENYKRFVESWVANDKEPPKGVKSGDTLIRELFDRFLADFQKRPKFSRSDLNLFKQIALRLNNLFPGKYVDEFGPKSLESLIKDFLSTGYVRSGVRHQYTRYYLNKVYKKTREVFKWGCYQEIVKPEILQALQSVPPLREGRTIAEESKLKHCVSEEELKAVIDCLEPFYADIVQILALTGMRPKELCSMKVSEIEQERGIWLYKPGSHKTKHKGKQRIIPLGKRAQSLLKRFLTERDPDEHVFTPLQAMEEHWAILAEQRKTKITPSQQQRKRDHALRRQFMFSKELDSNVIGHAVKRACNKAIQKGTLKTPWTPYELRHTAITNIRLAEGAEAAQHFAGHANLHTQDIYDHSALESSIETAKKYG